MMNFIYENLSIVLCVLGILTATLKFLTWIHFDRLSWESPNPGPIKKNILCLFSYGLVSTILSAFFFLLALDLFWIWEILIGVLGVWSIESGLVYLWFNVIPNRIIWFYADTKIGQLISKKIKEIDKLECQIYILMCKKNRTEENVSGDI